MKVLKITSSVWKNASRDIRELRVVRDLGAEVLVMAKGDKTGVIDEADGFRIYRMSTKPLGIRMPAVLNRCFSIITWATAARKLRPDAISGHDLIPLFIGWLSTLFMSKKKKPKLIYDSHEFTIYDGKKSKQNQFIIYKLEHFLIKKCIFSIEVSDSIAEEVQKIHKLPDKPLVVRNIPFYWNLDQNEILRVREEMLEKFHAPKDAFLISYHGGIQRGRGIEILLQATARIRDIYTVIIGDGEANYIAAIKHEAKMLGIENRVLFYSAVPIEVLYKYTGAVDVGFVCIEAECKSLYYSLPNKFFENIQSLTPMICSSFPEMTALNNRYHVGIAVDPVEPSQIDDAVLKLKSDEFFYRQCKENCALAKKELCWEKERHILEAAYKQIL